MPWNKQFNPKDALRKAMVVFWTKGYDATSMTDLLTAMGIQKGSFYDTFGSKHQIYLDAMDLYLQERFDEFKTRFDGKPPRDALLSMMKNIKQECLRPADADRGCFALNCALEVAASDAEAKTKVREALTQHERMLSSLIKQGQSDGTICENVNATATGKTLLGLTMAMRVYGKTGAPQSTFDALVNQAEQILPTPS